MLIYTFRQLTASNQWVCQEALLNPIFDHNYGTVRHHLNHLKVKSYYEQYNKKCHTALKKFTLYGLSQLNFTQGIEQANTHSIILIIQGAIDHSCFFASATQPYQPNALMVPLSPQLSLVSMLLTHSNPSFGKLTVNLINI